MHKKPAKLDHDTARALCDAGYMTHEAYARFCKDNGVSTNADSGGGGHTNPPPPETGED